MSSSSESRFSVTPDGGFMAFTEHEQTPKNKKKRNIFFIIPILNILTTLEVGVALGYSSHTLFILLQYSLRNINLLLWNVECRMLAHIEVCLSMGLQHLFRISGNNFISTNQIKETVSFHC